MRGATRYLFEVAATDVAYCTVLKKFKCTTGTVQEASCANWCMSSAIKLSEAFVIDVITFTNFLMSPTLRSLT